MAEAPDMLSVAVTPRPLSQIIAWRRQRSVSYGEFLDRTRAWQRLLTQTSEQTFALSISDAAEFAAALFGAWQARKTIYLPGDRLPRTAAHCVHSSMAIWANLRPNGSPGCRHPRTGWPLPLS